METDLLKYIFITQAYKLGSISKAAEFCSYTQPYVSKAIKRFEDEIGIKIFERHKEGVRVRKEALPTIKLIEGFLESYEQFQKDLFSQDISNRIIVGITPSFSSFHMPICIKEFSAIHPEIRIILKVGTYTEIEDMIESSTVDFGISPIPMKKSLSTIFLMEEPNVLICNKSHPLSKKGYFSPEDFSGETLITTGEGNDKYIRELYQNTTCEPASITLINNDQTLIYMVSQGLGISVIPKVMAEEYIDKIAMIDFSAYLTRKIGIGTLSSKKTRGIASLLINFLKENVK